MAIDAGYKITAISGKDGTNGQNGASLSVQYSVNGTSNWHDTFASGDFYMRQKLGNGSWSSAMKIVGEDGQDGADGDDGTNGTNTWYSSVSATTSTTSIALSTITAVAGHSVAVGDLIIANSLVFLVSAVGSTNATVSYKQSIKGSKGDKGDNSVTYEIDCPMVFKKGNTVTFTFYKVESGVRTSASVYARWYYSADGTNWTEGTGSKVTATSLTTTTLNSSIKVKCEIYASSSATTALDVEYSSLVTDGTNGTNGTNGARGSVWYTGNKITGTSTTATVFSGSGITDAKVGDMYKNTDTSYTYQCTVAGNASTAKWVYTGSIKGSAGTNGTNGTNATNVYLGNENITLACDKDGKLKSALSTTVKVGAYTGTARVASTITKNSNSSNVTVGTITNGTTSADGSVPLTMSASTAVTAGELVLKVVANSITFYKTVTISVAKDGAQGSKGDKGDKGDTGAKGADASQVGENLLHDSKLLGSVYGSSYPYYKYIDNGAHTANAFNGFTQTYCNNSSGTSTKDFLAWKNIKGFTLGDKYTLSFWAKGSGKFYTYWYGDSGYVTAKRIASSDGQAAGSLGDGSTTFTLTSEWKQYWVTWQLNTTGNNTVSKIILFRAYAGAQVYIVSPKFEKGEHATAWVPHADEYKGDKGDKGNTGDTGARGTALLRTTTAPTAYTTVTSGVTPAYRIALSTVKTEANVTEVFVGDVIENSYYHYPVILVDSNYVYTGARVSIRGATGATGATGTDTWTPVLTSVTRSGTKFTKSANTASWDAQFYSKEGFKRCYISWKASQTNGAIMVGLNSDPSANANWTSLDYAIYLKTDGTFDIRESNTTVTVTGNTYTTSDVFKIEYDGANVNYYKGTTLLRSVARAEGTLLYADSSFNTYNKAIQDVSFGALGEKGNDSYSCETSASAVSVSTGTDRKPTSAGSVNIVFKVFKGTTALSAVASSSSTVSASQFRVTTPTTPQGGLTITQSTNGTLNIAWATGTAIDATRSIAVTVAIGSTTNTVTKTITISASIKGGTGGPGSRAIRYLGKSATKPNSSHKTSGAPTGLATPISGDWYFCTTDGAVYYCSGISGTTYTWTVITWLDTSTVPDYRLTACLEDMLELSDQITTNQTMNNFIDKYTTVLIANEGFINKLRAKDINFKNSVSSYKDSGYAVGDLAISMGKNPKNDSDTDLNFNIQSFLASIQKENASSTYVEQWKKEFYTKYNSDKKQVDLFVNGVLNSVGGINTFNSVFGGSELVDQLFSLPSGTTFAYNDTFAIVSVSGYVYLFRCRKANGYVDVFKSPIPSSNNGVYNLSFSLDFTLSANRLWISDAIVYNNNIYIIFGGSAIFKYNYSASTKSFTAVRNNGTSITKLNLYNNYLLFQEDENTYLYDGSSFMQMFRGYTSPTELFTEFTDKVYIGAYCGNGICYLGFYKEVDTKLEQIGFVNIHGKPYYNGATQVGTISTNGTTGAIEGIFAAYGKVFISYRKLSGTENWTEYILVSNDCGTTWQIVYQGTAPSDYAFINGIAENGLIALYGNGTVFYSVDNGDSFEMFGIARGNHLSSGFKYYSKFAKDIIIPVLYDDESQVNPVFKLKKFRSTNLAKGTIIASNFSESSGYIVFSNGLIIQWGKKQQSDSTEGMRQYFPIHFTVPPIVTANSNSQDGDFRGIQECTTTYFKCDTNSGYSNKKLVYWIAIGY